MSYISNNPDLYDLTIQSMLLSFPFYRRQNKELNNLCKMQKLGNADPSLCGHRGWALNLEAMLPSWLISLSVSKTTKGSCLRSESELQSWQANTTGYLNLQCKHGTSQQQW